MAVVRPFSALRPPAERAAQVAAVPYDVVNTEEARALASGNPWSFLHVSRPEIDLPPGTNIYNDEVYSKAQSNFEKLTKECPLMMEEMPSLYLYRLIMGDHEQIGVVACGAVDDYDQNIIRKHERHAARRIRTGGSALPARTIFCACSAGRHVEGSKQPSIVCAECVPNPFRM